MHRYMFVAGVVWLVMAVLSISVGKETASFCYTLTANVWFVGGIVIKALRS